MKIGEVYPELADQSSLPPGGTPLMDAAYLGWASRFCERCNARWLDSLTGPQGLPDRACEVINTFGLTGHLYKFTLGDARFPKGKWPNYRHRMRAVAIQFYYRRAELVAESKAYALRLRDELLQKMRDWDF